MVVCRVKIIIAQFVIKQLILFQILITTSVVVKIIHILLIKEDNANFVLIF